MVFLFWIICFFLIIFLILISSKIQIDVKKFKYMTNKNLIFNIKIRLLAFMCIPIISISISSKKMEKFKRTQKYKKMQMKINQQIEKLKLKIIESRKNIKIKDIKKSLTSFENIKINIKKFKLNVIIGLEDVILTSFLIAFISTIISIFLKLSINNLDNKHYEVKPLYNLSEKKIMIDFQTLFELKVIDILYTIKSLKRNKIQLQHTQEEQTKESVKI